MMRVSHFRSSKAMKPTLLGDVWRRPASASSGHGGARRTRPWRKHLRSRALDAEDLQSTRSGGNTKRSQKRAKRKTSGT